MLKGKTATLMFVGWMGLVTLLSLFSFSDMELPGDGVPNLDKIVHFVFYSGMAFLCILALRERSHRAFPIRRALLLGFCFAVIYGIIIEVFQKWFTVDRQGDILDVAANTFGAMVGTLGIKILYSGKRQLKWKN
ncbi:MAG: VanZ family protein [Sediminicola sp.]